MRGQTWGGIQIQTLHLVGDEPERAKDRKNNQETSQPVLLKEDGTEEFDPENAHFLEFQIYQPLPYNALGLV